MHPRLTKLYFSAPGWAQDALVSAYGLRLRYLRYGGPGRRHLALLRHLQWLSARDLEQWQLDTLNATLAHARATVPYYRYRLGATPLRSPDDLRRLPLMSKSDVRSAGDALVSRAGARHLLEVHTGGTTGTPLTIYCDRDALQRNYAFFARFKEWIGLKPDARVATFAGRAFIAPDQARPPYWRRNYAGQSMLFSSYHIAPASVDDYIAGLASFRPALIDSYPSAIEPIARALLRPGAPAIRPEAVITSSETLTPAARRVIELAFQCPVFDYYGAAEMAAFISQCRAGAYHVNSDFGIVEILRGDEPVAVGEAGELVATGFVNAVMPLIRYRTGDVAVRGGWHCACGRAFPIVERLVGREDDVLVTPEGRRIGRLDPIFKSVSSLVETRIVQDTVDHVRVETVADADLPEVARATLLRELGSRLGPRMRIDIVRVPRLPRTPSGKFRAVVNLTTPTAPMAVGEYAPTDRH